MFKNKGQSTFEMVTLVAAVMIISLAVISNYLVVSDTTLGLIVAKQSITEKLVKQTNVYTIDTLDGVKCDGAFYLQVTTIPNDLTTVQFNQGASGNIQLVEKDIISTTNFGAIDLKVNEAITACPP